MSGGDGVHPDRARPPPAEAQEPRPGGGWGRLGIELLRRSVAPGPAVEEAGARAGIEPARGQLPTALRRVAPGVAEGLLRLHTDPAESDRLGGKYGNNLNLVVRKDAKLVLTAPRVRLASITIEAGANVWQLDGCRLEVTGESKVADGAKWVKGNK